MTEPHSTTFRAALYARVSAEDRQAPEDSIAWQRSVAAALIEPHAAIVVEYLDVGVSRSLPWSRRPEAARLLSDCNRRDRDFDAVVIGEPQRAFAGAQFALTFQLLRPSRRRALGARGGRPCRSRQRSPRPRDVTLRRPEQSPGALASSGACAIAMQTMARAGGRYLGGRPPYGYRLVSMR